MERPIFKLENALPAAPSGETDFEGPLDLILYLLSKNKLEIQDISVAAILDQYLAWLRRRQSLDLDVASEFIAMASRLMILKTRMLLSIEDDEARNEMDALLQSLEERSRNEAYARVQSAATLMEPLQAFGQNILTRPPEQMEAVREYDHTPSDLLTTLAILRDRAERALPPSGAAFREIVQREPYPVEEKAQEILGLLKQAGMLPFHLLFAGSRSRSEVAATFLAVLELCKAHTIRLTDTATEWNVQCR